MPLMKKQTLVSLIVASALFMEFLDQTVITTAIPVIAGDIGISPIDLKLGLTSYYLGLVLVTPASGWIGDRFGAQRVFLMAVLLFTLGSMSCGLSNSLPALVGSRFVQGLGGAMMVPVGRLIVLRSVSRSEMVNALTWLTLPAVFGPMIGPVIGGFITTYFNWRLIFWINVPIGIIGLALAIIYLPDTPRQPDRGFDRVGYGLTAAGLAMIVVGATFMGMGAVSLGLGIAACALGIGLLALYVRHAGRTANPLLDLGLFRLPTFRASFYGGLPFRIANGASPFLMPLFFQLGFGFNAFQSGLLVFLSGLGAIIMKSTTAPMLRRFGFRNVLVSNGILNAATLAAIFKPYSAVLRRSRADTNVFGDEYYQHCAATRELAGRERRRAYSRTGDPWAERQQSAGCNGFCTGLPGDWRDLCHVRVLLQQTGAQCGCRDDRP
jgi:EmrB/QacA subfamily drug resistance transporter